MAQPNAKWYDQATLEEMHQDLATEYTKTFAIIEQRPALLKHFNECSECQTFRWAHQETSNLESVELMAHRRRKLILRSHQLHALLGLKPDQRIVSLEIQQDPVTLSVVITGPKEPLIPVHSEAPIVAVNVEAA